MLVILLSLTLCLMAFLPFFQTRAASEFSTPLTEMSFIEQLYQSNYIQYKYLKEKLVLFRSVSDDRLSGEP